MLQPGSPIPPLSAPEAAAAIAPGRRRVLYFYPKDGTPACTMEACAFRDNLALIREHGAEVVGVSPDGHASHDAFARKYSLPFTLLSDTDGAIAQAFETATQQQWAGKTFQSVSRTTFLIDETGIIRQVWEDVDPRTHVQDVVSALMDLDSEGASQDLQARLQEARRIASSTIVSPFASLAREAEARLEEIRRAEGLEAEADSEPHEAEPRGKDRLPVDPAQVQEVLDTLRPFMQADGGDVQLVGIEDGIVKVRLQGACGTCPSSTVTLRMGIEARLKQRLPGLRGVEAVV